MHHLFTSIFTVSQQFGQNHLLLGVTESLRHLVWNQPMGPASCTLTEDHLSFILSSPIAPSFIIVIGIIIHLWWPSRGHCTSVHWRFSVSFSYKFRQTSKSKKCWSLLKCLCDKAIGWINPQYKRFMWVPNSIITVTGSSDNHLSLCSLGNEMHGHFLNLKVLPCLLSRHNCVAWPLVCSKHLFL